MESPEEKTVEITPAMIEAGVQVIDDFGHITFTEDLARRVYIAMERQRSLDPAPQEPAPYTSRKV